MSEENPEWCPTCAEPIGNLSRDGKKCNKCGAIGCYLCMPTPSTCQNCWDAAVYRYSNGIVGKPKGNAQ